MRSVTMFSLQFIVFFLYWLVKFDVLNAKGDNGMQIVVLTKSVC